MNSVAAFIEDLPNRRRAHPIPMLTDFAKPIIAAVNGYAVGIGCIVTYCCDMIVASERAEWRLPQSGLGIIPAQGGAMRLARWVGKGLAMRAAFGFPLKAEEAYRIGLAQWLVPHDALMARAMEVAEHIAVAAAAGGAADQGVAEPRHRRAAGGRGAGRSVSLRHAGDDRGQAGSAPGLARTPQAAVQGQLIDDLTRGRTSCRKSIRAVVVDPSHSDKLTLQSVELPPAATGDVTVRVTAISLNRGEVNRALSQSDAGARPGWDFAGIIEEAAADGSGPKPGTRVVGMLPTGAWAERIRAPSHAVAALPDAVTDAQAATLPVAGLTALHALRQGGLLLGRKVLVDGATGGVGHLAVQLAATAGAEVYGHVRRAEQRTMIASGAATASSSRPTCARRRPAARIT